MTSQSWENAKPLVIAGIALIMFALFCMLAFQIRELLLVLFLGVILGVTLNPFTEFMLRYHVPRIVAILVVYGIVAVLLAAFFTYAAFQVAEQDFATEIEEIRQDYEDFRQGTQLPSSQEVEDALINAAQGAIGGLPGQVFTILTGLVGIATILFTAVLFSITQNRTREVLLSFFPPNLRDGVTDLLHNYAIGLRGFARGELAAMVAVGLFTFIGLSLIGVRMAALLAFFAFIMELLPLIGPWVAYIPALVIGLTQGPWVAFQVSLLYLALQMFESYIVTPLVHSHESEVPALLIFVSITIGGALMGILGALVALPIAVLLRITYIEVIRPWNQRRFGEAPVDSNAEAADEGVPVQGS